MKRHRIQLLSPQGRSCRTSYIYDFHTALKKVFHQNNATQDASYRLKTSLLDVTQTREHCDRSGFSYALRMTITVDALLYTAGGELIWKSTITRGGTIYLAKDMKYHRYSICRQQESMWYACAKYIYRSVQKVIRERTTAKV